MNPVLAILFLLVPTVGGLLAATPWLMPRNECFAVTVPSSAFDDPRLARLRNTYLRAMILTTIVCMVAWHIVSQFVDLSSTGDPGQAAALVLLACITTCLPIVVSFALMLYFRSRVQQVKCEAGWEATGPTAAAVVGEADIPQPISLAWNLLYVPVVVALAIIGFAMYDAFPDQIPMHASFDGTVDQWVPKSMGVVLFPALMAAFLGIVFTACHWGILRSKKPVDPAAPLTSSLAYGSFARIQTVLLLAGGLFLSAAIGASFFLATMGTLSMVQTVTLLTVASMAFVAVYLVAAVAYGQSGARIAGHVAQDAEGSMATDADRYWQLGVFYVNRGDPSVFVPKRFGVGWTLNLGRPATWVVIACFAAFIAGFVLLVDAITR